MRKNIFELYNEQHANDTPKTTPNENYVKTENPEIVKPEPEQKENDVTDNITTSTEDVGKSSLAEERGEDLNGI